MLEDLLSNCNLKSSGFLNSCVFGGKPKGFPFLKPKIAVRLGDLEVNGSSSSFRYKSIFRRTKHIFYIKPLKLKL